MKTPHFLLFIVALIAMSCVSNKKFNSVSAHVSKLRGDSLASVQRERDLQAQLYGLEDNAQLTSAELAARKLELQQKDADLKEKARRMDELDRKLKAQTDAANNLRQKVADALMKFNAEDLSVTIKDGNVYVSLPEKLLFASGSAAVYPTGKEALGKLADVLNSNGDIRVMVEGHTDTIPIHTSTFKDNWELSVARATSIVRILTDTYALDPHRVTAAGRSEYMPIASNKDGDGRQKNRRTEIILIPKLDELFELVGSK